MDDYTNEQGCNICDEMNNENLKLFFSNSEWNDLQQETKHLKFSKGDTIISEGEMPNGIYVVKNGTAKLFKIGFNGKEQILRFIKSGEMIGYRSLLCNESYGASAIAMETIEICYIPEKLFYKMLETSPKIAFDVLKKIALELGEASRTITLLAQKTVRERLAEVLLLLEQKLDVDKDGYIKISLTREELANLIGTATESAIRLLSEFKTDKLIEVDGRRIKILNHQKLTKLGHVIL